jgi:LacI family transcriptional regulator
MPAGYVVTEQTADESGEISGYEAMNKLLTSKQIPDGVFCFNDPTAMGAMQAILDAGLRFLRVPLTSVDQNSEAMGRGAGELALSLIGAKTPIKPRTILLEPSVVIRESTQR